MLLDPLVSLLYSLNKTFMLSAIYRPNYPYFSVSGGQGPF